LLVLTSLQTAVVLAAAIAVVASTVSLTKICAPLRVWVARRDGSAWTWVGQLIGCPYCLSHWLAFAATAVYRPRLVTLWWPLDLLVTAFAIVALAMVGALIIRRVIQPVTVQLNQSAASPDITALKAALKATLNGGK
jgi:hypothetical protein